MTAKNDKLEPKRKMLNIGHRDGKVVLGLDGMPFGAFDPLQALLLAVNIHKEAALAQAQVAGEAVDEALEKIAKEESAKSDRS